MSSPFPNDLMGCPFDCFIGVAIFWAIIVFPVFQESEECGVFLLVFTSLGTTWLWGRYGLVVPFIIGGIALISLIIIIILIVDDWELVLGFSLVAVFGGSAGYGIYYLIKTKGLHGFLDWSGMWILRILIGIMICAVSVLIIWGAIKLYKAIKNRKSKTPHPPPPPQRKKKRKEIYYHGTSNEAALEIWNTDLWKGDMEPAMLWFADNTNYAVSHAKGRYGSNAKILVLRVHPKIKLHDYQDGRFHLKLDSSNSKRNYYKVQGVDVIQMLDLNLNVLKRS